MRVLQLGKHYPPAIGGTERVIETITKELNRQGVLCDVLCANIYCDYVEDTIDNYRVMRTASLGKVASTAISPQMVWKLKEIQDHYDIIHLHMPDPMANLALFITKPRSKILLQWHMDIVRQRVLLKFYKPLLSWLLKRADKILVSSKKLYSESQIAEYLRLKGEVLPLPFDTAHLHDAKECEKTIEIVRSFAKGRRIILFVGRLVYYKGVEVLINALKFVQEEACLIIVGDGPLKRKCENLVEKLGLINRVLFFGKADRSQLKSIYQEAYLLCLPSLFKSEAFGVVQLEAMSFGKPVVSTILPASGVCGEVNIDGETGLCVEPNSPLALSEAIDFLLSNPKAYQYMSAKAKRRVEEFKASKIIDKLVTIYKTLL